MTRRRWIADRVENDRAFLTGSNAAHLAVVLRARPGQEFDVAANGVLRSGTVLSVSPGQVELQLGVPLQSKPGPEVSILLSIFKFDRMEWAIEKLTELGAAEIVPVIARRSEPHLAKAAVKRVERWRKIAHESAQQARLIQPPQISDPQPLNKIVAGVQGSRIVLSEVEENLTLKQALAACTPPIALALGPEGGWAAEELDVFRGAGWCAASLGSAILRTETAAIAAAAVAVAELGF